MATVTPDDDPLPQDDHPIVTVNPRRWNDLMAAASGCDIDDLE